MRLALALTMCGAALTLAACGTGKPDAAGSVCGLMAREIADARGATPRDQAKLDGAVEAAIRAGCVRRADVTAKGV